MKEFIPFKIIVFSFLAALCLHSPAVFSQGTSEKVVRAALVYKMMNYISRQDGSEKLNRFVFLGEPAAHGDIVKFFKQSAPHLVLAHCLSVNEVKAGDIVFLPYKKSKHFLNQLREKNKLPILTVASGDEGENFNAIISFSTIDSKTRFSINNKQAKERGLLISSKLLQLARGVK